MHYLYDIFIYPIELIVEFIYARANRVFANPGLSIIAVSLLVNILVLPLYNRSDAMQEEERRRQAAMKHWSDHIKKTFKGDERFMIQSAYYRQQSYKPVYALRGSFSLLLQIPFFIAAYHFLSNLGDLQGTSFLMLRDLGQQDGLIRIGDVSINLLPVLMTGINIVSGALYTKGFSVKEKLQLYGMALIFLVLLYTSPSGLVFYWTLNNLFSLGKNIFLKLIPPTRKARAACLSAVGIAAFENDVRHDEAPPCAAHRLCDRHPAAAAVCVPPGEKAGTLPRPSRKRRSYGAQLPVPHGADGRGHLLRRGRLLARGVHVRRRAGKARYKQSPHLCRVLHGVAAHILLSGRGKGQRSLRRGDVRAGAYGRGEFHVLRPRPRNNVLGVQV